MYLHELLKGLIQNLLDQSGDVCVNAQSSDVFGFWIGPLKLCSGSTSENKDSNCSLQKQENSI